MTLPFARAFVLLEHATFRGPRGPVFAGCTLRLEPGQRWAVLGPSGSGKGLLLDGLMGRLPLLAGRLRHPFLEDDPRCADSVFGVLPPRTIALASMREHRQWLLARDFHQMRWHGSLVESAVTVGALLERAHVEQHNPFAVVDAADGDDYQRARQRELARFGLGPLLQRPVAALSNGELHRFVLARAMLRRPRLLLLDDPIAGLDADHRRRLLEILDELDGEGVGVVVATEREDDLPAGITHVVRLEAEAVTYAGPRGGETRAPPPVAGARFTLPRRAPERAPAGVPILDLRNASVRLGELRLLDGISLQVAQSEHWAVLGPNGSGKSTLLSLVLADHPQVHACDLRIAGRRLGPGRSIWDQKSYLGWLSPELETYYPPHASTFEVVLSGFASSLGMHRVPTAAEQALARQWLSGLGLPEHTPFAELPRLARRLALLARAAVHGPSLLLLDEPCQGLDPGARATLLAAVAEASLGTAMIYVTHDLDELPASVSRVLALEGGRTRYQGPRAGWVPGR